MIRFTAFHFIIDNGTVAFSVANPSDAQSTFTVSVPTAYDETVGANVIKGIDLSNELLKTLAANHQIGAAVPPESRVWTLWAQSISLMTATGPVLNTASGSVTVTFVKSSQMSATDSNATQLMNAIPPLLDVPPSPMEKRNDANSFWRP